MQLAALPSGRALNKDLLNMGNSKRWLLCANSESVTYLIHITWNLAIFIRLFHPERNQFFIQNLRFLFLPSAIISHFQQEYL